MVGYGSHTRVPHMSSPLFRWLAYWIKVTGTLLTVYIIVITILIIIFVLILIILKFLILIRIWNG